MALRTFQIQANQHQKRSSLKQLSSKKAYPSYAIVALKQKRIREGQTAQNEWLFTNL